MAEPSSSAEVPLRGHLQKYDVPKEVIEDILKVGYEDALVWANAFKEDDLAKYFLRQGSPFGPSTVEADRQDTYEIVAVGLPTPTHSQALSTSGFSDAPTFQGSR